MPETPLVDIVTGENNRREWLQNLKVGDEVVVVDGPYRMSIRKIAALSTRKNAKTEVFGILARPNSQTVCWFDHQGTFKYSAYSYSRIEEPTPELRNKIRTINLGFKIKNTIREIQDLDFQSEDLELLQQVLMQLKATQDLITDQIHKKKP